MRRKNPKLYGTKQVAEMLRLPTWRVKNFSEGEAFRLPPSVQVGKGRGSRRLYHWKDVCRIAIADKLVRLGFAPEAVGLAVREIPESKLVGRPYAADSYVLIRTSVDNWYVDSAESADELIPLNSNVVIPFQEIIHELESDLMQQEEGE